MEETEKSSPPEESLKLSDQKSSESIGPLTAGSKDAHHPRSLDRGDLHSSAQEPRAADECFHDCNDSFEVKEPGMEQERDNREDPAGKQTELDEEYLLELEKNMPEEEKQSFFTSLESTVSACTQKEAKDLMGMMETELILSCLNCEQHIQEMTSDRAKRRKESTKLKEKGNEQFKKGEYGGAEDSYTKAVKVCPACYQKDRSVLFSNRAAARMKQDKTEAALSDCSKAIELDPNYIRALLRRAELYEKTEKLDEALEDYKTVLEKDPSVHHAREACMRLPRQIEERNERLKTEMLGKLKDLGNLVLRPFGLSTENFQVKQDSSTGSYSINFVQNPNNNNR